MFAKIQFLGQKGKTINEETYKSFLEWFMSSASSKKGNTTYRWIPGSLSLFS